MLLLPIRCGFVHSFVVLLLATALPSPSTHVSADDATWPQWRGPSQQGISPDSDLPLNWDEESTMRVEIPGDGGSTPVIVGDTAYLTSGVAGNNVLFAIDLPSSADSESAKSAPRIRWQTPLGEDRGKKHRKGSGSNPSPVTDGKHVVAYFRSGDLACVDVDGKLVWQVNLQDEFGEDSLWWDLGSSPLLIDSMVVVPVMQTGPSYLVAYDVATGEMKWKAERMTDAPEEAAQSYSTPLAVEIEGQSAIAVMGADHLTINATADGKELARLGDFNPDGEKFFRSIASPVADGNLIICPYSRGATLTAVDMKQLIDGKGKDAIVWFRDDLGSDVPTPAMRDGIVYLISDGKQDKGTAYGLSAATGETLWSVKLPRSRAGYSSSPLIAGERMYVTAEDAKTYVIGPLSSDAGSDSSTPDVIANNEIADNTEYTVASPIPMTGRIGLRTRGHFYVIGG